MCQLPRSSVDSRRGGLGDDLGARDCRRHARARGRHARLRPLGQPCGPRRRAVAARRPAAAARPVPRRRPRPQGRLPGRRLVPVPGGQGIASATDEAVYLVIADPQRRHRDRRSPRLAPRSRAPVRARRPRRRASARGLHDAHARPLRRARRRRLLAGLLPRPGERRLPLGPPGGRGAATHGRRHPLRRLRGRPARDQPLHAHAARERRTACTGTRPSAATGTSTARIPARASSETLRVSELFEGTPPTGERGLPLAPC